MLSRYSLLSSSFLLASMMLVRTVSPQDAQAPAPSVVVAAVNPGVRVDAQAPAPAPSFAAVTVFQLVSVEQAQGGPVNTYNVGVQLKMSNWIEKSELTIRIEVFDKANSKSVGKTMIGAANGAVDTAQYLESYNGTVHAPDKLGTGTYYCEVGATIIPKGTPGQVAPPQINFGRITTVDLTVP